MTINQKQLKTPLRYPGGKSRAISKMHQYFPDLRGYDEFREPFLGGGSVALGVTKLYPSLCVWVNDLYEPLINFWKTLQQRGPELSAELLRIKMKNNTPDSAKILFLKSKEYLSVEKSSSCDFNFDRAVSFYIVNKCSFSGLTEASSFSAQASDHNFTERGISLLPEYSKIIQNWRITNLSYEDIIYDNYTGSFVYLDPPYDIKDNLYGRKGEMHKTFDHDKFAEICNTSNMNMMISYNSDQLVKNRFTGEQWKAYEFAHTYTMRSVGEYMKDQQERKELLLLNYDLRTERLVELDQSNED